MVHIASSSLALETCKLKSSNYAVLMALQVAASQQYTAYLQRMKRAQSIQNTWSTLRKKDKASLLASLASDDTALAEAALPDAWDSRSVGVITPPKNQGDCGT